MLASLCSMGQDISTPRRQKMEARPLTPPSPVAGEENGLCEVPEAEASKVARDSSQCSGVGGLEKCWEFLFISEI